MKNKFITLFTVLALVLTSFVPVFGQNAFTCKDLAAMNKNQKDSRWRGGSVKDLAYRYGIIARCIKKNPLLLPDGPFWQYNATQIIAKLNVYYKQNKEQAELLVDNINSISRAYKTDTSVYCIDKKGRLKPCSAGSKIDKTLEEKRRQSANPSDMYMYLAETLPEGKPRNKEEVKALQTIAQGVYNGCEIKRFVEQLVTKNSKSISNNFINSVFMIFAQSLSQDKIDDIYQYAAGDYPARIKLAAARAIAVNSADRLDLRTNEEIDNRPRGRFYLSNKQRRGVKDVFAETASRLNLSKQNEKMTYNVLAENLSRIYELGTGKDFTLNVAKFLGYGKKGGDGSGGYVAAGVIALAVPAEEAAAYGLSVSSAALAEIAVPVGAVVIFYIALEDAYKYPSALQLLMDDYSNLVDMPALEEAQAQALAAAEAEVPLWQEGWAAYGAKTQSRSKAQTCRQQPSPESTDCSQIKKKNLKDRGLNKRFEDGLNENLKRLGVSYNQNTTIGDILRQPIDGKYRQPLEMLNQKCNQFSDSSGNPVFMKVRQVERGYIPEVEVKVKLPAGTSLKKVFSNGIWDIVCSSESFLYGGSSDRADRVDLNNGRTLRNSDHERNSTKKHIHYEEKRGNYLCNHSVFFDDSSGSALQQIRQICQERRLGK